MIKRDIFDDILDQIYENTIISQTFIEEDIEEPFVTVNKHIGILAHLALGKGLVNDELLHDFINKLIKKFNHRMCKRHALDAIKEVNQKFALFLATFADLS